MTIATGFFSRRIRAGFSVALRTAVPGDLEIVYSAEVLAFRSKSGKCFAVLTGRIVQTLRPLRTVTITIAGQQITAPTQPGPDAQAILDALPGH